MPRRKRTPEEIARKERTTNPQHLKQYIIVLGEEL